MEITCLSVPNPLSYLICAGVKDVENRGYPSDYRGTVYVHSTGRYAIRGMPDLSAYPVPLIHEFDTVLAQIQDIESDTTFIGIPEFGVKVCLKDEDRHHEQIVAEYGLLSDVYQLHHDDPDAAFFHVRSLIGTAELVDVCRDFDSPWAEDGFYHFVFDNPVLFEEPITGITTTRTRLWTLEVGDEKISRARPG